MKKKADKKVEGAQRGRPRLPQWVADTLRIPVTTRAQIDEYRTKSGKKGHEGSRNPVYVKAIQSWLKWREQVRLSLPKDLKSAIRKYAENQRTKIEDILVEVITSWWDQRDGGRRSNREKRKPG